MELTMATRAYCTYHTDIVVLAVLNQSKCIARELVSLITRGWLARPRQAYGTSFLKHNPLADQSERLIVARGMLPTLPKETLASS